MTREALWCGQAAVQVEYIYGARSLVKIIDILSDDRDGSH